MEIPTHENLCSGSSYPEESRIPMLAAFLVIVRLQTSFLACIFFSAAETLGFLPFSCAG